jgi:hypothetical protein
MNAVAARALLLADAVVACDGVCHANDSCRFPGHGRVR